MPTIQILIRPGHKLFKCNLSDGIIHEVDRGGDTSRFYESEYEKGTLYASALNMLNAKKKFDKMVEYIIQKNVS